MPRRSISSITYLSPTGQRTSSMPALAERQLESDVAHHRRDDGVAARRPVAFSCRAHISMHRVAVHDAARGVDEDRAVAVAVERDAHPAAALDDRRASVSGCVDPHSRLMLRPSGVAPITLDVEASS